MRGSWKSSAMGLGGALLVFGGVVLAPTAARASSDGKKNTALGLGAAAAYELLNGKTTAGLLLGAGAAYAAKQYEDARHTESQQRNRRYYDDGGDYETFAGGDRETRGDGDYETRGGAAKDFRHMSGSKNRSSTGSGNADYYIGSDGERYHYYRHDANKAAAQGQRPLPPSRSDSDKQGDNSASR